MSREKSRMIALDSQTYKSKDAGNAEITWTVVHKSIGGGATGPKSPQIVLTHAHSPSKSLFHIRTVPSSPEDASIVPVTFHSTLQTSES
ncbi:hypothetical protein PsorP6_003282 [Peronosclerospora sorghi]|uniref:Uncharacterized protein n=1 Tax=Peronosclerospora sorghi TaxID=230839 RepID=A0ACC0VQP5_9STRA|nr:hypothetical protein PsorP6_003282 [Peronosclerospora sorghi]